MSRKREEIIEDAHHILDETDGPYNSYYTLDNREALTLAFGLTLEVLLDIRDKKEYYDR